MAQARSRATASLESNYMLLSETLSASESPVIIGLTVSEIIHSKQTQTNSKSLKSRFCEKLLSILTLQNNRFADVHDHYLYGNRLIST